MTERDIFIAALQKENPAEREVYLQEACRQRPGLREQVEGLLRLPTLYRCFENQL